MRKIYQEIKNLNSNQLDNISNIINDISNSISRLADDARRREVEEKKQEQIKLRKFEQRRLAKLKLQRAIMTRYMKGQSFEQIGAATSYHPKTIYKMIRRYEHDLSVLHKIDYDIEKSKIASAERLIRSGMPKKKIIKKLNISAHAVVALAEMEKMDLQF